MGAGDRHALEERLAGGGNALVVAGSDADGLALPAGGPVCLLGVVADGRVTERLAAWRARLVAEPARTACVVVGGDDPRGSPGRGGRARARRRRRGPG